MRNFVVLFFFLASTFSMLAQQGAAVNLSLVSNTNDYNIGSRSYNDVWGYVDRNGR